MSGPFGSSPWGYNPSTGFYDYSIDQSLRFNDDDSAKLTRTPSSAGNRATWTWSAWVKRSGLGTNQQLFCSTAGDYNLRFNTDDTIIFEGAFGTNTSAAVFRDVSAFYNIVAVHDTTESTSSDRFKLYVNGVQQTTSGAFPSGDGIINNTVEHGIGGQASANFFDGYMAEVNFIDGTALDHTSFGETSNGVWVPKQYSGSYGTNGFYLPFDDSSAIGDDESGNTNDFTATNLAATDVVPDSPTNNFATLNPLYDTGAPTHAEGNLQVSDSSTAAGASTYQIPKTGKWYFESKLTAGGGVRVGVSAQDVNTMNVNNFLPVTGGTGNYFNNTNGSGTWINNGTGAATGGGTSSFTANVLSNVLGVTVDVENLQIYFQSDVGSGLEVIGPFTINSSHTDLNIGFNMNGDTVKFNFGQDSSFSGSVTSGSAEAQDANGVGDFYYTPPTDALALCTSNLTEPAIGPNSDTTSDEHFNTVLYTGNGSTQSITGVGFQPDWVWIKERSSTSGHSLFDVIRGAGEYLGSHSTAAEATSTTQLTSFDADGFTTGASGGTNQSGQTYASWNWKAGGTAVSNTDGSITSSVSANQDAGFSIVSYTGNGTDGATVGHGLNSRVEAVILKDRDNGSNWNVKFKDMTSNQVCFLNTSDDDESPGSGYIGNFTADDTFTLVNGGSGITNVNRSGADIIAYCFHSVEGYSKVGTYVGNGQNSPNGTFVYTGFRPAWVMVKDITDTSYWVIIDNKRAEAYNIDTARLYANDSASEAATNTNRYMELFSNGFRLHGNNAGSVANKWNESGDSYIYLAFAEAPFKYANAR